MKNSKQVLPGPEWHPLFRRIMVEGESAIHQTLSGTDYNPLCAYGGWDGLGQSAPGLGGHLHPGCLHLPFPSHQLCTATAYQPPCLNWNFANGRTDADIAMESASELPDTPALCTCGHALLRRGAMSNLASPPLNGIYIKKNIIRIKKILLESKKIFSDRGRKEGRKEGTKERRKCICANVRYAPACPNSPKVRFMVKYPSPGGWRGDTWYIISIRSI